MKDYSERMSCDKISRNPNQPTQQRRMKRLQAIYADVTSSKAHDVGKYILIRYASKSPCAVTCRIRTVHCLAPQISSSEHSRILVLHLILCSKIPLRLRLPLVCSQFQKHAVSPSLGNDEARAFLSPNRRGLQHRKVLSLLVAVQTWCLTNCAFLLPVIAGEFSNLHWQDAIASYDSKCPMTRRTDLL